ncbi:MAG: hypothetical protein P8O70_02840 [SAR324 cluster bacterium]|nr:hypothetical protein [SAR324 cluster bacterium]
MDPDDASPEYQGWWIYIDPDEHLVELVDLDLDLDTLCELLRCDATDLIELNVPFLGYVDGEGEWQERQTRWYLQERECWGPMVVFRYLSEEEGPGSCSYKDLEQFEEWVDFY